ncbi:MAG: DUF4886 domain-containing protein, partial [Bacteroidaceae bacterium]|nr:DUF4886 domain-containing protein [Bacteroidaceae bacterium]
ALPYKGNGVFEGEATLPETTSQQWVDKTMWFALNNNDAYAIKRLKGDANRYKLGESEKGETTENILQNAGTYTITVDMAARAYDITKEIDENRISVFGSSVANGQGATDYKGYRYLEGQNLQARYDGGESDNPFYTTNISIGGNTTTSLANRYDDLIRDYGRYVIFGLSLGNEGIHGAADQQKVFEQWRDNMLALIDRAKADGKIPMVMNNYTRGDYNDDDYHYVKQLNLLIHEWDVASTNCLGSIDDGTGKWSEGYIADNAHPNTAGHQEFFHSIVPSLFDAIKAGKAQPVRDTAKSTTLEAGKKLCFVPEDVAHPFTLSLRVKGTEGELLTVNTPDGVATVRVNADGTVTFTSVHGTTIHSTTAINDDAWHYVTLTSYYAAGRTLLYVDKTKAGELAERMGQIGEIRVGDNAHSRDLSELTFWRSGMTPEEVASHCDGKMLKSSLELYAPIGGLKDKDNLAQSTNSLKVATTTTVKINFIAGNLDEPVAGWNKFTNNTNTAAAATALTDVDGKYTNMNISLLAPFNGTNQEGVQTTNTVLNMTKSVSYSAFWSQAAGSASAKASSALQIGGLKPGAVYTFTIFGSRKNQTDNRETEYTLAGKNTRTAYLNTSSNATNVAVIDSVLADENGLLTLTLKPGPNNNNSSKYYYINAMQIEECVTGTPEKDDAIRILAIGNSFSEDAVEQNLYELAKEAGVKLIIGNAYRGGQSLQSHWDDVTEGKNTFEYRKVVGGVRTNITNQALATIVENEPWDFITFQQVSQNSGQYETYTPYLQNLIDYVKSHTTTDATKYGFHQTWAYAQHSTHGGFANYDKDQTKMYNAINGAVQQALADHPALTFVVPSGTAIQNARTSFLGDNLDRDGYHLDYAFGRYTAACTWLETVLGITSQGLTYCPSTMETAVAKIVQEAAHNAVVTPFAVTDMMGKSPYDTPNDGRGEAIKINFGNNPTTNPAWNNLTPGQKVRTNLTDVDGNATRIIIVMDDPFNDVNASGNTSTTTDLDMPSEVSKSCFWGYAQGNFEGKTQQPTGGFVFSHMNADITYTFDFYGSRSGCSDNREVAYTLVGTDTVTVCLDAANNSTQTVRAARVRPTSDGKIHLTVSPGKDNDNTYKFYYINALRIIPNTRFATTTVGSAGYSTFVAPFAVSELPEGVEVYGAEDKNNGYVQLNAMTEIPDGEPVVLKNEGTYTFYEAEADVTPTVANELVSSTVTVQADGSQYVLAKKSGKVGF